MNEKLIEVKEMLLNKVFYYSDTGNPDQKKTFFCKDIALKNSRFVIDCEIRRFVFLLDELESFLKKIQLESTAVVKNENLQTVVPVNENVANVSNALFNIFNKVANKTASKEDIEDAKLMISLSNQLVGIEKIKLGYYNLQKK
jgi:hypothetical protein